MYTSLTFYYSISSLKEPPTDLAPPLITIPDHFQLNHKWLQIEHYQHQQWTSNLMHELETTYNYDLQGSWELKRPTNWDPVCVEFTPLSLMSSKLFYSQLAICPGRTMFSGLCLNFSEGRHFQPLEWQKFRTLHSESVDSDREVFHQLLCRFAAWFKFSKRYLSFYVRKVNLEEDGQISETFSNTLICHWLRSRYFATQIQGLHTPYMEPTHSELHNHLKRLKETINRLKTVQQSTLIVELNSYIHHWVSVSDLHIRWATLTYCDNLLRRRLQRWAKRRHPNKGWGWVCDKYWRVGPTASKYIFWLWLLNNVGESSKKGPALYSTVKAQLVNLIQMDLSEYVNEMSSLINWQFFCVDSREGLFPYTVMAFKKWRKSRSFKSFLLY